MSERKPQYVQGHDDAVESIIQLLTIYCEIYPTRLSETALSTIMDPEEARSVLEPLVRFHARVITECMGRASAGEAA